MAPSAFARMKPYSMPFDPSHDLATLMEILCRESVQLGDFTLASGAKSSVYVDAKLTTCSPEAMPLVGRVFIRKIQERGWLPQAVGGLTVGADPISFAIARESIHEAGRPIRAFIVRKEPKKHGMGRFIEGLDETLGRSVVIIDDVCTKGGSTATAIEKAREAGMHVLGAVCLVDREQGAAELLQGTFDCTLQSIFTLAELLAYKQESTIAADPVGANN